MTERPTGTEFWPIEDYAIIGDCRSAALVSRSGSIDWLCWPRFDSPAIFAALLDCERGGHFSVRPAGPFESVRRYRPDSNVLVTRFETPSGAIELTDLFYASEERPSVPLPQSMLIRHISGVSGEVEIQVDFEPRDGFGAKPFSLRERGAGSLVFQSKAGMFHLAASFDLTTRGASSRTSLTVRAGQRESLVLSFNGGAPGVFPPLAQLPALSEATDRYWRGWAEQIDYEGPHRGAVVRSALALKLMVYAPSGALIAAPTTSLPEKIGASYNWDYRYCWLRDASYTINALFGIGLRTEARAFQQWLLHATRLTAPELQVMYSVLGEPLLKERTLDHLSGYRGSRPVRTGNAAHGQKQLDIYGEVLRAAVLCRVEGVRPSSDERSLLEGAARYVLQHWREPDAGIWETRLGDQHHVHSKAMCWLALDRAAYLARAGDLNLDVAVLERATAEVKEYVRREGFNARLGAYTAVAGGDELDAAVLRLVLVGFEDANEPRMASTIEAVRSRLGRGDLLFRHENEETEAEGAFLLCSFWLVQCLAAQGKMAEAESLFGRLCARANEVGLYAEEVEVGTGGFLGNFPQAFTHVGLINSALVLERLRKKTPEAKLGPA